MACLAGEALSGASTAAALAVMRRKEAALRALGQLCGATGAISEVCVCLCKSLMVWYLYIPQSTTHPLTT